MDLSEYKNIGKIKTITMDMEASFEMKIKPKTSMAVVYYMNVLEIFGWFDFGLRKSDKESKYYIHHWQGNGLGHYSEILKSNPISVSNNWKKEFLETILKPQSFKQI